MKEVTGVVPYSELEKLGLGDLFVRWRDRNAKSLQIVHCNGPQGAGLLKTARPLPEKEFESHEAVSRIKQVCDRRNHYEYTVVLQVEAFRKLLDACFEEAIITKDIFFLERGVRITMIISQEAIEKGEKFASTMFEGGINCYIEKVNEYQGSTRPLDNLTERQQEAFRTAYEVGYFEVPREVTSDEIADELDVNNSTALELVRRAEQNLMSELIEEQPTEHVENR